jgi:hypothetical protein
MSIKKSKRSRGSKRRMSPAMRKQASTVKRLAAHYRKTGKVVAVPQLAKQAAKINAGKMKMPSSRKTTKKSKRTTKRSTRK